MRYILLFLTMVVSMLGNPLFLRAQEVDRQFVVYNASNGLADNGAQSIVCTKTGRMVIMTIGHVNFYDGHDFSHIDPVSENVFRLPDYHGYSHPYFDKYHHLWQKNMGTVTCLNLTQEQFISNIDSVFKEFGVKDRVTDMFCDDNGCLWLRHGNKIFGSETKKDYPLIPNLNLQDLAEYDNRLLLLFYENGDVVALDLQSGKQLYRLKAYADDQVEKYKSTSLILKDGQSYFQIRCGKSEGILLRFDVEKRQWTTIMSQPYRLNNMVIHEGVLYLSSAQGYWTYNLTTKETKHVESLTLVGGKQLQSSINTIEFDRQGGMWIGTETRGLFYAKPFTSPFHVYALSDPRAAEYMKFLDRKSTFYVDTYRGENADCVLQDSRGWIWVGTRTGLKLYKSATASTCQLFTRKQGLFNDIIHSIVEDQQNHIWVGTSYGISRLAIKNGKVGEINTYATRDNVPVESFVDGRSVMMDDGTIVMQSVDHVVTFNPKNFHFDTFRDYKFYPKLIGMMVNGTRVEAGTTIDGKQILDKAITRSWEVNVDYNHNNVTLLFSALNFFRPLQSYYRYRVPEIDSKWKVVSYANSGGLVDGNGMFHLPLPGLTPGDYHIEVQASMYPDVWIQEPIVWTLHVNQPWWRATSVYAALAAIVLILLILNLVMFSRNTRMKIRRFTSEQNIIRQLRHFVNANDSMGREVFSRESDIQASLSGQQYRLDEDFMSLMLKMAPYLNSYSSSQLTLGELCKVGNVSHKTFLNLVSKNITKKPYEFIRRLRLQQAANLLKASDKSVEDIADECGFCSPNFFVASFFRQYRLTPQEYRQSENQLSITH